MDIDIDHLDQVGPWTREKLELLQKYLGAYTTILTAQRWCTGVHYIDAFAGASRHVDRETQQLLDGSPRVALSVGPPFQHLWFVELSEERVHLLEQLREEHPERDIRIVPGDCNQELPAILEQVGPTERAFLLLDPYNLGVKWATIEAAARAGKWNGGTFYKTVEILINFCLHDANRNVIRRRPELMDRAQARRLTEVWGDDSWRATVYRPELTLFGTGEVKEDDLPRRWSEAYAKRLRSIYDHVSKPVIMRNTRNAPQYSLILASHVQVAQKIMDHIADYAGR